MFLTHGKLVINVVMALPLEEALALLDTMIESFKRIIEDISMELLKNMATQIIRLQKSLLAGQEQELVQGQSTQILDRERCKRRQRKG